MSYRIMELSKSFSDDVFYRASCMCGSEDCDMVLEIEHDKELDQIILTLYKNVNWHDGWSNNFFTRFWERLKTSMKIMFTGHFQMTEAFIFENEEQIREFTSTLESGIIKINENREKE